MAVVEVRDALPYVSHIKIVKRANKHVVPTGEQDRYGNQLGRWQQDQPSIQVETLLYVGNERGPGTPYTFYSKAFLQGILASARAVENPDDSMKGGIALLERRLAEEKLWLEDVLERASLPDLESLWVEAFSESLDSFPQWKEPTTPISGVKLYMRQIEWDVRIDPDSNKSVQVIMGQYLTEACDSDSPIRKTLQFEDGATRRARMSNIETHEKLVIDRKATLDVIGQIEVAQAMPMGPERTAKLSTFNQDIANHTDLAGLKKQVQQELAGYESTLAQLKAVTYGLISDLLAIPSIQMSVAALVFAIIETLKANLPEWKDLDMAVVQSRFALPKVD